MAQFIIPTPLRKFTGNQSVIDISGSTVEESIRNLVTAYPGIEEHLLDQKGKIRRFINIFVGESDIRTLDNEQTPVKAEEVISIVPAIAGG